MPATFRLVNAANYTGCRLLYLEQMSDYGSFKTDERNLANNPLKRDKLPGDDPKSVSTLHYCIVLHYISALLWAAIQKPSILMSSPATSYCSNVLIQLCFAQKYLTLHICLVLISAVLLVCTTLVTIPTLPVAWKVTSIDGCLPPVLGR